MRVCSAAHDASSVLQVIVEEEEGVVDVEGVKQGSKDERSIQRKNPAFLQRFPR